MDRLMRALDVGSPLPGEVWWSLPLKEQLALPWGLSIRSSVIVDGGANQVRLIPRREYGAAVYWDGDRLFVGGVRYGEESSFTLDPGEMAPNQFRGYYHTHPYPLGIICSFFSDSDFAAILTDDSIRVLIAQSGYRMSLLARAANKASSQSVEQVKADYAAVLTTLGVKFPVDDVVPANKEMCKNYDLALYDGELRSGLRRITL